MKSFLLNGSYVHLGGMIIHIYFLVFLNLPKILVNLDKETSMSLADWPVGKLLGHFLDNTFMWECPAHYRQFQPKVMSCI